MVEGCAEQEPKRLRERERVRPIRVDGDVAYIPLTQGFTAIIDAADVDFVSAWNWHAHIRVSGEVYAARSFIRRGKQIAALLHRQLLGLDGPPIDHADRDGLNNRRANLRICTASENAANRVHRRNSGLAKGVVVDKGKFRARIKTGAKTYHLGSFPTAAEAAAAYAGAARVLFGEFARTA